MAKMNKARELLIKEYVESLEQEQLPWNHPWGHSNAVTGHKYRGVNNLLLNVVAERYGYSGTRWCTFAQIADRENKLHPDAKWHLKKGSKGFPIEYWSTYNTKERKNYSFREFEKIVKANPEREDEFRLVARCFTVFNEDCIEGIEPQKHTKNDIKTSKTVEKIITNMDVGYKEEGKRAFYRPSTDTVTVPPRECFFSEDGYQAVRLHELSHATGHYSRLDRNIENYFGTPEYAKEELRAEISSSFLMQDLNLAYNEYEELNSDVHVAYIQSWISILKNDPNELFKAIKDAENIVEYMEEKGEITKELQDVEKNPEPDIEM